LFLKAFRFSNLIFILFLKNKKCGINLWKIKIWSKFSNQTHHQRLLRRGRRSHRGSSSSAPTQEGQPSQDEGETLTGHAINEADAPIIDLESGREKQAYELLKERVFLHSLTFDPVLLKQIGMDVEFNTVFGHVGWSRVAPVHELGSRLLTIQFLGTLQIIDYGISFR